MKKEDAHRLRKMVGILMRSEFSSLPDMQWLAKEADELEKKSDFQVLSTSPIVDEKPKGKKKK